MIPTAWIVDSKGIPKVGQIVIHLLAKEFAMGSPVTLRTDYDAKTLRQLAKGSRDTRQARRLLSLAAIYDGMNRTEAAHVGAMDRQTLRDWVHRFNDKGPDGLTAPQDLVALAG